jgi:hypothetical protein
MSAVVSAVQSVGKAIGKVVEAVGDAVEKVAEVVVDTVKYVAENPEILVIAIAAPYAVAAVGGAIGASATAISLATQPITAAAITASQGGDLEDIGKAALGSFIAQPLGNVAGAQASKVIGSGNAAQSALSSAVGGAVGSAAGAVVTGGDVGESALFGAAGSAGASLARTGATSLGAEQGGRAAGYSADVGEALGRSAAGGDLASELIGAGVGALVKEGDIAVGQLRQPTDTQVATRPAPPPIGAQIGEQLAGTGSMDISAPASISSRPEFATKTGETGDIVIKYTEPDGYVTYRRDVTATDSSGKQSGYTIVYDPQDDSFVYEYSTGDADKAPTAGVSVISSKTRPGDTSAVDVRTGQRATDVAAATSQATDRAKTAREILDRRAAERERGTAGEATAPSGMERQPSGPITGGRDAGGMGEGEMAGTDRPVEDMTGSELLGDAIAGGERGEDVGGGGGGEREGGGGGGEGLSEAPFDLEAMTDEELLALLEDSMDFDAEDTPLIPPDDTGMTGGLDVRTTLVGKPKAYQSSISPRVVGSSPTAAIVGEKEPIFGGEENAQSDLWNTRSLRLRKALGL